MRIWYILRSVANNSCPKCHRGKVFSTKNPYHLKRFMQMNSDCTHCGLHYEKEPGFFYGAMYAAYALTSGWFIVWYILDALYIHLPTNVFLITMVSSFVILAPLTFRWSRLLWLNFFNAYQKNN